MKAYLTRNIGWKLLSLAVAVLVWLSVANEPELATFASVPVQYKDLPSDLEIASDVVEHVTLELRGPSGELRDFADNNKTAVVLDMSGVHAGEQTFTITNGNIDLPRAIRLVRTMPAQVRFDFERRRSRTVPVRVRFKETPPGYRILNVVVLPEQVTVVGPQTRVDRVQDVVTDPIDLSTVVGTAEFHVNAFASGSVRISSSPQVTVRVTMKKK